MSHQLLWLSHRHQHHRSVFLKQAVEPFTVPLQVIPENFGSVPKHYIRSSMDNVLSTELQDKMISHWNVEKVFTLESGHFPLTSIASQLVAVIQETT